MKRREFSAKVKLQAFERSGGHCENCGAKLFPGNIEYDHINPDSLGGSPTLDNCMAKCRSCHKDKTRADAPVIAKSRRIRKRHAGIKRPSRMPGARNSPWKKKITGEVVRR